MNLRDAIEQLVQDFPGYSYRRVTAAFVRAGWSINQKRVLRVMREESLLGHPKRRFVVHITNSHHGYQVYPNLIEGIPLDAPDVVLVVDLTSIRLTTTFVYLACVLDALLKRSC